MSLNLNKDYWTKRYLDNDAVWDIGYISPPLKNYFDQITNKQIKILIPGAGNSYEAEYLVNNGFENVYVCDLSAEPLHNLQKRCPKIKKENLIQGDFFELNNQSEQGQPGPGQSEQPVLSSVYPELAEGSKDSRRGSQELTFDLIVEQTFFCAIDPAFRKKYFEKMYSLLNPGGHLMGVLFDDVLNTDHPPFGGNKAEYLTYIPEGLKIKTLEACYNSVEPRQGRELFMNLQKIQT